MNNIIKGTQLTLFRDLIKYPSCLDYIQVAGEEIASKKPSLSRQSSTASMTGALKWDHLNYNPQITAGKVSPNAYNFGDFMATFNQLKVDFIFGPYLINYFLTHTTQF